MGTRAKSKAEDLAKATTSTLPNLTDNLGHLIGDDQNSLHAGERGPSLLEDFYLREKISHFDHERIPERVVHARGAAAHGFFELYTSLECYTTAKILCDTSVQTPLFTRFSTVAGSRGSADTARDVRGFAVKFYTDQGIWDLVGNNIPVFFIQDAIKFPDLIHSVKPEPNVEIPQASSAHDTFYDFLAETPESMHMLMWIMSDRAIPRSFAMMDGFGVHTFRLVNADGVSHFVKFHWKTLLGAHSLLWDEAQKIAGLDPDFHRRGLADSISQGNFPEWELGVQLLPEADELKYDFDVLDATKLWPENLIPVQRIGKMTLNRNPDNYFSETEQVAFMPTNVPPGIDFSNDPLLQGRLFSYLDTQLSRLGSPNWTELPINRPINPVSNNERDGHMRFTVNSGTVAYGQNKLNDNRPEQVVASRGGFTSYSEQMRGTKVRARGVSFNDHYGQARLFWNSVTPVEREHIARALQFELSKVQTRNVRLRMLHHLNEINGELGAVVAGAIGEGDPTDTSAYDKESVRRRVATAFSATSASGGVDRAEGISIEEGQPQLARSRIVAILAGRNCDAAIVQRLQDALRAEGATGVVIGPHLQELGGGVAATVTFAAAASVLFDAVFVPGGAGSVEWLQNSVEASSFILEAYKHGKPIGASDEGVDFISSMMREERITGNGLITGKVGDSAALLRDFVEALAQHRFAVRPVAGQVTT